MVVLKAFFRAKSVDVPLFLTVEAKSFALLGYKNCIVLVSKLSDKKVLINQTEIYNRSNFSIVAHPDNPEIILFGGEFYNGQTVRINGH